VEPKLSKVVELRLVEASSHISNFSSLFVRLNEQLNVTCTIEAPQKTDFVYWYKNKQPIQYDQLKRVGQEAAAASVQDPYIRRATRSASPRGGGKPSVPPDLAQDEGPASKAEQGEEEEEEAEEREEGGQWRGKQQLVQSKSLLTIKRAKLNDTANYTCQVSIRERPDFGQLRAAEQRRANNSSHTCNFTAP